VKQVLENQQLTLLSQRVRLDVRVEDVTLVADRGKIRLILENLLSNASSTHPRAAPSTCGPRPQARSWCSTWPTAARASRPRSATTCCDAFYTGRAAKTTAVKGTGIGLSVVLDFVAAHGGNVQIVDGEFPGAHFRITMPIRVTSGDRPARREPKAHAHAA